MIAYISAAGLFVIALLLFFSFRRRAPDVSTALRQLLLARAEGKLTELEFEQRQSALHAALLSPAPSGFSPRSLVFPALLALMLIAAVGLYSWLDGAKPNAPLPGLPAAGAPFPNEGQPPARAGGDMNEMLKRLADKLAKDPRNGEGWALLGHSYIEVRRYDEAAQAFAKAAALLPPDAALLADWADAYVMAHERKWDKAARDIVNRALAVDPKHLKTLALAGSEAFDRGEYAEAIAYWKRMKAAAPADSMDAKLADANMQEATARMSGALPAPPATTATPFIAGTVKLSAKLKDKVAASDTVFVVAKAIGGGGPPLAVRRYMVSDLPAAFRLDESAAMVPGQSLANVQQAMLLARISKSGNAIPQPGDIQTAPLMVKVGTGNATLELGP